MAKRGKKIGGNHYEFKYREKFEQLMKPKKEKPGKFLGFRLKLENVNQLWRWDSLENIS